MTFSPMYSMTPPFSTLLQVNDFWQVFFWATGLQGCILTTSLQRSAKKYQIEWMESSPPHEIIHLAGQEHSC
jgi:protoheme ferro-lyase